MSGIELDTLAKLLACPNPWCNSRRTTDCEIRGVELPILMPDPSGKRYAVACPVCPLQTPWQATDGEAITAWNRRNNLPAIRDQSAELTALRERVAVLEGALKWIDDHADDQDISHVNFRISAGSRARAALTTTKGPSHEG